MSSNERKLIVLMGGKRLYRCKRCREYFETPLRNRTRDAKTKELKYIFACPECHVLLPMESEGVPP